jgi:hypothetical protein
LYTKTLKINLALIVILELVQSLYDCKWLKNKSHVFGSRLKVKQILILSYDYSNRSNSIKIKHDQVKGPVKTNIVLRVMWIQRKINISGL